MARQMNATGAAVGPKHRIDYDRISFLGGVECGLSFSHNVLRYFLVRFQYSVAVVWFISYILN